MEVLDDEDLALVINKFQRFYQNRKGRKKGERTGCFNCGDPSHFVADCPKKKREEYDYPRHKDDSDCDRRHKKGKKKHKTRFDRAGMKKRFYDKQKREQKAFFA